jgi:hypothetical protein
LRVLEPIAVAMELATSFACGQRHRAHEGCVQDGQAAQGRREGEGGGKALAGHGPLFTHANAVGIHEGHNAMNHDHPCVLLRGNMLRKRRCNSGGLNNADEANSMQAGPRCRPRRCNSGQLEPRASGWIRRPA